MNLELIQQELYEQMLDARERNFPMERPAIFSPAAAAQDPGNRSAKYFRWTPLFLPYEFTHWLEESRAHVESCYIGDWSAIGKLLVRGPEALAFLARTGMNNLGSFEIGQIKHHVQLDENGYVASEGVIYRMGEEEFLYTGGGIDWTIWQFEQGSWNADIENVSPRRFIFEVQGPKSLSVLEAALGESLRDLDFNRGRPSQLSGAPVHILRTGISGELGYELHGSANDASRIWGAVVKEGEPFGLRQLGVRAQLVQHIEAGIATAGLDYFPASIGTPGQPKLIPDGAPCGSFVPAKGLPDYFRYPSELGWGGRGRINSHEFVGRDALRTLEERGGAGRRLVNLVWNSDDVCQLFAALFSSDDGLPEPMEMPRLIGGSYDSVRVGDREVGVSTSCTYSANLRKVISLCVIDEAHSKPGSEVIVLWGTPGRPQREIRATISETPLKPDRRRMNVADV